MKPFINIGLLYLAFMPLATTHAQTVSASVDKKTIVIGEQIKMTVRIDALDTSQIKILQWFKPVDSLGAFEITSKAVIDTLPANGKIYYRQTLTLTSFSPGEVTIPSFEILLLKDGSEALIQNTEPLQLVVLAANVDSLENFHDVTNILSPEDETDYWLIAAIAGGILLVFTIAFICYKKITKKRRNPPASGTDQWEKMMSSLHAMAADMPSDKKTRKEFYTKLSAIYSQCLSAKINSNLEHLTTNELIISMSELTIAPTLYNKMMTQLINCDNIRFAENNGTDSVIADIEEAKAIITAFRQLK